MYASLGNFTQGGQGNFPGQNFASAGLTNAYQPFGYSSEPQRSQSSITIEDIINALQNSRMEKVKLEQNVANFKDSQPKPIDLNKGNTCYIVAHKTFATGNVWQPDTPILPNESIARFELQRLKRNNPETEYRMSKLEWTVIEEKETPRFQNHFEWDYSKEDPHAEPHVEEPEEEHDNEGGEPVSPDDEKRFVFVPRPPSKGRSVKDDPFGFPEI